MRFLAIFDGLFFAWQWWEIALFKGKNRFAVGGVRPLEEILRVGPGQAVNASIDDMMDAMSRQPLGRRRGTDWDPFFARRDD